MTKQYLTVNKMNAVLKLYGLRISRGKHNELSNIRVWYIHREGKKDAGVEVFSNLAPNSEILEYIIKEYT